MIQRFYRLIKNNFEYCYYIETSKLLNKSELKILGWLIAETFEVDKFNEKSFLGVNGNLIEIGPRLNFETAFSTNAVAICNSCGLEKVTRIERSRRYLISKNINPMDFVNKNHDRMTECVYPAPLETFGTGIKPDIMDKIFMPFFTSKKHGSGIGLSLTRQIMHLHKGTITVRSKPDEGSVFTLMF